MSLIEGIYSNSSFLQWLYKKTIFGAFLQKIKRYWYHCKYNHDTKRERKEEMLRRNGYEDPRFQTLKNLKGKYAGKRCFIACTGPSLTIADLESLEREYVFGMNSICLIHDKTNWKPDFYGIQDVNVFEKVKDTLLKTDNGKIFAPYYYSEIGMPSDWVYFHISSAYHMFDRLFKGEYYSSFSDDCYATVFDGFTITHSLLQIATYLGFDEIYLLGADCNYLGKSQHFIEHGHMTQGQEAVTVTDRLISSYSEAKRYCDEHNIKIYNATRGGCLEIFPRVNLDEVVAKSEKNKSSL